MISDLTVRFRIRRMWLLRLVLTTTHFCCWFLPDKQAEYVIAKVSRLAMRIPRFTIIKDA